MLREKELRAPESQNSIRSKSRFSLGLSKAVGTAEAPAQECVSGGLYAYTVLAQQLPGVKREICFPVFPRCEGIPSLSATVAGVPGSDTSSQSSREGANSPSPNSLPAAAPFGDSLHGIPFSPPPEARPWSRGVSAGADRRGRRRSRGQQWGSPESCPCEGPGGKPWLQPAAARGQAPAARHVPATEAALRGLRCWRGAGCPAQGELLFSSDYRRYLLAATFPASRGPGRAGSLDADSGKRCLVTPAATLSVGESNDNVLLGDILKWQRNIG